MPRDTTSVTQSDSATPRLRQYLTTLGDIALAGELPLDDLLQRIVEMARSLLHARYAALGVFDAKGRVRRFYTAGITAEERARIGPLPVGTGLLGHIVTERRIVRCAQIADHPASVGFPPDHPPMTSFLGGPIARGDVVFGNLYLTDRVGAPEFSAEDAELLDLLARQSAIAIENAKRFARARQEERAFRALFEIGKALSSLSDPEAVVELVVRSVLDLLGADVAGLCRREPAQPSHPPDDSMLRWTLLRGSLGRFQQGTLVPARSSLVGRALQASETLEIDDLHVTGASDGDNPLLEEEHLRSLVVIPLSGATGALLAGWRTPGAIPEGALDTLKLLADRAVIALTQTELLVRKQAALRQSEIERSSLAAIFDSLQDAVFTTNLDGQIVRLNPPASAWAQADAVDQPAKDIFCLVDDAGAEVPPALDGGPSSVRATLVRPNGERIAVERVVSPIRDASGRPLGMVQVLRDLRPQQEVERLKATIISLVSHELRTPLSHIKGYASSLLQTDVAWDAETQRDFIASIERQADRLGRLIGDLLEISRLDAGGTARLEKVSIAPAVLVARGIREAQPNAGHHSIGTSIPEGLPLVLADPSHIERVLSNLIENAAKYSPENAPIQIEVADAGDAVVFAVRDQGTGLTPDERAHLFERFYRSPRVKHRTPGTGLGLAICYEIIQAHGGRIWAENGAPSGAGKGSVFRFTLPRASTTDNGGGS